MESSISQAKIAQVTCQQVTWQEAETSLRQIRTVVFIDEQLVTPEFEWDDIDAGAIHLLAMYKNQPIGCLRIIQHEKIGRMAVLRHWRGLGVGNMLLTEAIDICRLRGSKHVYLSAQTHAIPFYLRAGFQITSAEYTDVHIAHVDMQLVLD